MGKHEEETSYSTFMSKLVPTPTIDKNGRQTTVHKRSANEVRPKWSWLAPRGDEASRKDILQEIHREIDRLTNGVHQSRLHTKMASYLSTESLQGMLRVLSSKRATFSTYAAFDERSEACSKSMYREWADEFIYRYEEMKGWSNGARTTDDQFLARTVSRMLENRRDSRFSGLSPVEETNLLRLSVALIGSGIGKFRMETDTHGYGPSLVSDGEDYLRTFVMSASSSDEIIQAEELIVYQKVNRIEDIGEVVSGSISPTISEGFL